MMRTKLLLSSKIFVPFVGGRERQIVGIFVVKRMGLDRIFYSFISMKNRCLSPSISDLFCYVAVRWWPHILHNHYERIFLYLSSQITNQNKIE